MPGEIRWNQQVPTNCLSLVASLTPEFNAEAIKLCSEPGQSIRKVAKNLGLTETGFRDWIKQAKIDAGNCAAGALTTAEKHELAALPKENRELRMEREILKRQRPSSRSTSREVRLHRRAEGPLPSHNVVQSLGASESGYHAWSTRLPSRRATENARLTRLGGRRCILQAVGLSAQSGKFAVVASCVHLMLDPARPTDGAFFERRHLRFGGQLFDSRCGLAFAKLAPTQKYAGFSVVCPAGRHADHGGVEGRRKRGV